MINTTLRLTYTIKTKTNKDREMHKEVILPYQLDISPHNNYDNKNKVVRISIGALDTKDSITPQLATVDTIMRGLNEKFADVEIESGELYLKMENCLITKTLNEYGLFFDFESVLGDCKSSKLVKGLAI